MRRVPSPVANWAYRCEFSFARVVQQSLLRCHFWISHFDSIELTRCFRQALFVSLALIFWFAIVFSAFVHTLHPHLFYHGDVDSDLDDYDHACILEEELRHSEHPLAGEALEWLQSERAKGTFTATVPPDKIRARRSFRAESEESGSESELEEEKDRKSLIPTRPQQTTSRGRAAARRPQRPLTDIMSDSEESGLMSEPEKGRSSEKRAEKELGRSSRSLSRSRSQSRGKSRSTRR